MSLELKAPIRVRLDRLYLDPNNPRLAVEDKPGYDRPSRIFPAAVQEELETRVRNAYKGVRALADSIVTVGWLPIDPMLVWEHPKKRGHFVVLEGNTRTAALRAIARDLQRERTKLAKARKNTFSDPEAIREQEGKVARYEAVVKATAAIEVLPVAARDPSELGRAVPRLLGVRHINHAQQWKPYALNLYVCSVYRQLFEERQGRQGLRLDEALLQECAAQVSMSGWKVRRAVQAVMAFHHFRSNFSDRLPAGEALADEDQAYLLAVMDYAREEFAFGPDDLWLQPEMEEVLFRWAFSRPRGDGSSPNRNVLRSSDDIRLWDRIRRYDEKHRTRFASSLDVRRPEKARALAEVEPEFLAHRAEQTPLEVMQSLVRTLKEMEVETIRAQRDLIRPAIDELLTLGNDYRAMLDAIEEQA